MQTVYKLRLGTRFLVRIQIHAIVWSPSIERRYNILKPYSNPQSKYAVTLIRVHCVTCCVVKLTVEQITEIHPVYN